MSLYRKLLLFMLGAAVVPLAVVGFALAGLAEDALRTRIVDAQRQAVLAEAEAVGAFVRERVEELRRAASHFDLEGLEADALQGAVRVLYRSAPEVAVTVLVDDAGRPVAEPAFLADPAAIPDLADHPSADAGSADRLLALLPRERAVAEGVGAVVLSPVYGAPERDDTAMAVALPVAAGDRILVYGAELSLRSLRRRALALDGLGIVSVIDGEGRFVVHPDAERLREAAEAPEFARALAADAPGVSREDHRGDRVLAAFAPVPLPGLGWSVVASLSEAEAFAPVRRMRRTILAACAVTVALLLFLGALFVRGVQTGLGAVTSGAEAFTRGDLAHRIDPPKESELAELARTFNAMGEELSAARAHLMRWNETLQAEVEARTAELKAAQARLLQAQKLAAVGQLGAGVAHEVNNPLAGILGNVQLLLLKKQRGGAGEDDPDVTALKKVEEAAKRCREITTTLLRFSQQGEAEARRDRLAVNAVATEAIGLFEAQLAEAGVRLVADLETPAPEVDGDGDQLVQMLVHLLSNARNALQERSGGTIRLATARHGEAVVLEVADDGKGIDPAVRDRIFEPFFTTKDVWTSLGLGLALTYRIVEDHGGTIEVESAPGEGTVMRVRLPAAGAGSAAVAAG